MSNKSRVEEIVKSVRERAYGAGYDGFFEDEVEINDSIKTILEILDQEREKAKAEGAIAELERVQDRWGGVRSANKQSWIDDRLAELKTGNREEEHDLSAKFVDSELELSPLDEDSILIDDREGERE